jgi:hypothetical protein
MPILNTMVPVFGIIALGLVLARVGFLTEALAGGLNRIVYFVALPALLLQAGTHAGGVAALDGRPLVALTVSTLAVAVLAVLAGRVLRLQGATARAFLVTVFFGNLTYIGLPVITHSLGAVRVLERPELLASTIVVLILMNIGYNVVAVIVLQPAGVRPGELLPRIASNPLLLAGGVGLTLASLGFRLPEAVELTLGSLGGLAIPGALLCVGASLLRARIGDHLVPVVVAAALKVFFLPFAAWLFLRGFPVAPGDTLMVLVLAACPTAVASYSLAREMQCAPEFTAATITVSTVFSFVALTAVLAVSGG